MNIKQLENQCKYEEYALNFLKWNESFSFSKDMLFKDFLLEIENILSFYRYLTEDTIFHLNDFSLNSYMLVGLNEHQQLVFVKSDSDFIVLIYYSCIEAYYKDEKGNFKLRIKGTSLK